MPAHTRVSSQPRARRHTPTWLVATVVLGGILLSVAVDEVRAQATTPLSAARFAALDTVYAMSVGIDAGTTSFTAAKPVCEALDRADRLLAIHGTTCRDSLDFGLASEAFGACATPRGCGRGARRTRIALSRLIADFRRSNAIVAVEVPAGDCRTELTASRSLLRDVGKLRDALRLLERGIAARSPRIIARAETQIADASAAFDRQPTAQQSRETYLRVCAPGQAPAAPQAGQ